MSQLIGIGSYAVFCLVFSGILLFAIKAIMGLRVSPEVELEGLDTAEHNMEAYPNFIVTPADGTNR
jgi:Amt family ammonium transporter